MKSFLKKLISDNNEVSSKRVLSLYFTLLFTGVVIVHLFGIIVSETIIWALVGLIGAGFGFTSVEKFKR